jgi:hypothetical protein
MTPDPHLLAPVLALLTTPDRAADILAAHGPMPAAMAARYRTIAPRSLRPDTTDARTIAGAYVDLGAHEHRLFLALKAAEV